jgi:hypothetical protein
MTAAAGRESLANQLILLLQGNDERGLSDEQISAHFGANYVDLVPIINSMLSSNRLQLFSQGGALIYKIVKEELAAKFEGLGFVFIRRTEFVDDVLLTDLNN